MKTQIYSIMFAILAASAVSAQETTTKTKTTTVKEDGSTETTIKTTTSSGTISEYVPGTTFIVKETSGPVSYQYGKKVVYVTKGGQAITEDDLKTRIKVGESVSVHYVLDGENRVISKVVIGD